MILKKIKKVLLKAYKTYQRDFKNCNQEYYLVAQIYLATTFLKGVWRKRNLQNTWNILKAIKLLKAFDENLIFRVKLRVRDFQSLSPYIKSR